MLLADSINVSRISQIISEFQMVSGVKKKNTAEKDNMHK